MHNSLVKLVDIALIPAAIMVVGKALGLIFTAALFSIPWTVTQITEAFFNIRPVVSSTDILVISTYSDAFMLLCVSIGFSFVLVQATKFHDTHISPRLLVKLSNNNLMGLVKSSFDVYHTASIWLIFSWLALLSVGINIAAGKTEIWLGVIGLAVNSVLTAVLLQDVYSEIDLTRKNLGSKSALS
ncbi:MAG: hypothetical protein JNK26_00500 [Candidatus Doudnabacteria bacterium]|nr:hypothetical protein [Candidatus Doudnabacteria bacterium]